MTVSTIISYDGTMHDDDALMLGRMLSGAGAALSLAYVRHSQEYDPRREEIGVHDAQRRLEQGASWLDDTAIEKLVVVNPSTSAGLGELAVARDAALVIFGSDYRTPPGRVEPGAAARGMLDGGSVAVAVAAAGVRTGDGTLHSVAVASTDPDGPAARTGQAIATATGAELVAGGREADLTIVDSRANAPAGRVALDGATRARLDSARGSVIVLAAGAPLAF